MNQHFIYQSAYPFNVKALIDLPKEVEVVRANIAILLFRKDLAKLRTANSLSVRPFMSCATPNSFGTIDCM